jgi:SnoaL-like domain
MTVVEENNANPVARWSVGGIFLEALANRDFEQMLATLQSDIRFRALLPSGPVEWHGPEAVAEALRSWFGEADDFELVDATVGEVGGRLHLSWRLRIRPAPFGMGDGWHVIEQQAYADAGVAIGALDLLCSGFNAERGATGE